MVVNFKARGISQNTRKLARTPTLNPKKKINDLVPCLWEVLGSWLFIQGKAGAILTDFMI
jgi:hypothetical protein